MDFKALAATAVKEGNVDMTKAKAGGGDFEAPKAGPCLLRLVGYFEIGKHAGTYMGKPTNKEYVQLVFEASGPNHPPIVLEDGTKMPIRITVEETFSLSEKGRFFALCKRLLYKGDQQHVVGCIGEAYKGRIVHRKYAKKGEDKTKPETWTGVAIELFDKAASMWTVEPPRRELIDEESGLGTGEYKAIAVAPMLTEPKAFLWNQASLEMWNSLFIDGEYPERKDAAGKVVAPAKSKNVIQNTIKKATNFKGSAIHNLLVANGADVNLDDALPDADEDFDDVPDSVTAPAVAAVPTGADADDALNGVV